MTVNINDACEITLTKTGYDIISKYNNSHYHLSNKIDFTKKFNSANPPKLTLSLWEIMKIFGPYVYLGIEAIFENNNMEIRS